MFRWVYQHLCTFTVTHVISWQDWSTTIADIVFLGPCSEHDVRLRGGQSHSEGRVEICFNNRWGRVCSGSWSNSDGNVICRQLGFSPNGNTNNHVLLYFISLINVPSITGAVVHSSATFGPGIGPIFLDDVHCSGTESRLVNCFSRRVSYYYCFSFEEAGVTCQSKIWLKCSKWQYLPCLVSNGFISYCIPLYSLCKWWH